MANPVDWNNLKPTEKILEKGISDDERMYVRLQAAEAEEAAQSLKLQNQTTTSHRPAPSAAPAPLDPWMISPLTHKAYHFDISGLKDMARDHGYFSKVDTAAIGTLKINDLPVYYQTYVTEVLGNEKPTEKWFANLTNWRACAKKLYEQAQLINTAMSTGKPVEEQPRPEPEYVAPTTG
jgi:hypothetical protein